MAENILNLNAINDLSSSLNSLINQNVSVQSESSSIVIDKKPFDDRYSFHTESYSDVVVGAALGGPTFPDN